MGGSGHYFVFIVDLDFGQWVLNVSFPSAGVYPQIAGPPSHWNRVLIFSASSRVLADVVQDASSMKFVTSSSFFSIDPSI